MSPQPAITVSGGGVKGGRGIALMINDYLAFFTDIARRTAAVVVALPCKTCPIVLPSIPGRIMHHQMPGLNNYAFQEGLIHAENIGGDIERVLNQRCVIGAFPWRYDGLESCPCRIICFFDVGEDVEAVGQVAKALAR